MSKIETIVAGTSGTGGSDAAVVAAAGLARRAGADLVLVHSVPLPTAYYGTPMGMTAIHPQILDAERTAQRKLVEVQCQRLGIDAGAVAEQVVEIGIAHRLLLEVAESRDADLIVVGASEDHGPLAPLLGSTTERVLRKARCPVLVARGELPLPSPRILAPVDLSPLAAGGLGDGLALLDACGGGHDQPVEALFVVSRVERRGSSHFTPEQVDRFARQELERFLAGVDPEGGSRFTLRLREGSPREEIVAELEERPVDLVLISTHGHSGFERFLLGSVAADVVAKADCSVLVVPPHAEVAAAAPAVAGD